MLLFRGKSLKSPEIKMKSTADAALFTSMPTRLITQKTQTKTNKQKSLEKAGKVKVFLWIRKARVSRSNRQNSGFGFHLSFPLSSTCHVEPDSLQTFAASHGTIEGQDERSRLVSLAGEMMENDALAEQICCYFHFWLITKG